MARYHNTHHSSRGGGNNISHKNHNARYRILRDLEHHDEHHDATNHPQFTLIVLGMFMLGVTAGILITTTNHKLFGGMHWHVNKGKVHAVYPPLERQRLNASINQKLAQAQLSRGR